MFLDNQKRKTLETWKEKPYKTNVLGCLVINAAFTGVLLKKQKKKSVLFHKVTVISPYISQFQAECVSGCVCPEGLFDDGRGGCVEQKDCPCIHHNLWYSPGQTITVGCNTW